MRAVPLGGPEGLQFLKHSGCGLLLLLRGELDRAANHGASCVLDEHMIRYMQRKRKAHDPLLSSLPQTYPAQANRAAGNVLLNEMPDQSAPGPQAGLSMIWQEDDQQSFGEGVARCEHPDCR